MMGQANNHQLSLIYGPFDDIQREGQGNSIEPTHFSLVSGMRDSVCLADVVSEEIDWLWPDRFAVGKLTIIAGDPGVGKSTATLDIAARVTTGCPWPDAPFDSTQVGSVLLLSAEDGLADTIKPRLEAAGADLGRVHSMTTIRLPNGRLDAFNLKRDLPRLEAEILGIGGVRLVVIDPVSAFVGGTDDHRNAELRGLLAPLAEMADRLRVAVILVTHLNKNIGGKSSYRIMGSLAYVAAARAAYLIHQDPNEAARRMMLRIKNNLSQKTSGLAYRIDDGRVDWESKPVNMTADQLLAAEEKATKGESQVDRAARFLRDLLEAGPIPSTEIKQRAEDAGFSESTLRKAKTQAGIVASRVGFGPGSICHWMIPSSPSSLNSDTVQPEEEVI